MNKEDYLSIQVREMSIKYKAGKKIKKDKLNTPKLTADFIRGLMFNNLEYKEVFYILNLDRQSNPIGYAKISEGGTSSTIVDVKIIMQHALLSHADRMILAHNHPSGSLTPSNADISITKKINEACKVMDITLDDHLIITSEGFYSFSENGLL